MPSFKVSLMLHTEKLVGNPFDVYELKFTLETNKKSVRKSISPLATLKLSLKRAREKNMRD